MKCEICLGAIETIFLDKVLGTTVKDKRGKKHLVCFACQKKYKTKKELLEALV